MIEKRLSKHIGEKSVAKAKALAWREAEEELETPGGDIMLRRIAKARDKASKDFTHIKQIKDDQGTVLKHEKKIKERWGEYFKHLLNEENLRSVFEEGVPNQGLTPEIRKGRNCESAK